MKRITVTLLAIGALAAALLVGGCSDTAFNPRGLGGSNGITGVVGTTGVPGGTGSNPGSVQNP